jgi:hypothetical protein
MLNKNLSKMKKYNRDPYLNLMIERLPDNYIEILSARTGLSEQEIDSALCDIVLLCDKYKFLEIEMQRLYSECRSQAVSA